MAVGGRGRARERVLRRAALIAGALVLLALVLLVSGHWLLALVFGAGGGVAIWVFLQARAVR